MGEIEPNANDGYWSSCIRLIEKTFVPRKSVGESRPCFEEDFQDYRATVDQNFRDILSILQHILDERKEMKTPLNSPITKIFKTYLTILIGEHHEKNLWTTAKSIQASQQVEEILCNLYSSTNLGQLLAEDDDGITRVLTTLRPKLLKNTWKTYPAAVFCYKWFLGLIKKSAILHLSDIIPTILIIFDDFVIENQILGLECLSEILEECYMEKKFVESGFAQMVFENLKKLIHNREPRHIFLLYSCIGKILNSIEFHNEFSNVFEWSDRDNILEKLLETMECEENLKNRNSYLSVLSGILNSVGSFKWCGRVIRILKDYCQHYDSKSLKITLESVKSILLIFESRLPAHCETLYPIFLKLSIDSIDAGFEEDVLKLVEDCISFLNRSTPEFGKILTQDDRIRTLIERLPEVTL
ncbi:TELO2-interacting protein 2-like [Belonocnema kinseyi]|uniref:TELO2-interacting protein 2-like n=1 Tax=Belonocnema kinseyi TaxID=2817044 RepID=UPI00143D046D|nr:TELO2-interacting protein 2-like [Belonocnema kinseyi]